jgi:protein arginine N-methyltransferase 1
MYSVSSYGSMIKRGPRLDGYVAALRKTIRPGSVVVDLGSGPGIFGLVACGLGARRVFAIEPENIIQVGRDAAREHGFADRIEFIQSLSTKVTLPEKADVIVSDLRGVLPWCTQHLPSIVDARARFLAADGVLIAQRDLLWAALVEAPQRYEDLVRPWEDNRLSSGRRLVVNSWFKYRVQPEMLLGQPVCWHEFDYRSVTEANVCRDISLTVARRGTAHGLAIWFDADLCEGIGFTNAPDSAELIYGNAFFPFEQPLEVGPEDHINVRFEARLIGDDYVWSWNTTPLTQGIPQCEFKQSTVLGTPLSTSRLHNIASPYVMENSDR